MSYLPRLVACLLLLQLSTTTFSQRSYFKQGRATTYDIYIIIPSGSDPYHFCITRNTKGIRYLPPEDVSEYRPYKGNRFIATEISPGEVVFLEAIVEGEITLYQYIDKSYKTRFFVRDSNDTLYELEENRRRSRSYRSILRNIWISCPSLAHLIGEAKFNRASLSSLITSHNTCSQGYISRPKTIVEGGVGYTRLIAANARNVVSAIPIGIVRLIDYDPKASFHLGIFKENPISSSSTFITYGLSASYSDLKDQFITFRSLFEAKIRTVDVSAHIGIKYVEPNKNIRPFITIKFAPSYLVMNETRLFAEEFLNNGEIRSRSSDIGLSDLGLRTIGQGGIIVPMKNEKLLQVSLALDYRWSLGNNRVYNLLSPQLMIGYEL